MQRQLIAQKLQIKKAPEVWGEMSLLEFVFTVHVSRRSGIQKINQLLSQNGN